MGTDLATVAAYLTPQEAELAAAILNASNEREFDDERFSALERFALADCPALPQPNKDEFRRIINALAGTLKAARASEEQGKLQYAMYWVALRGLELFRLQLAGEYFIKTAEWMPTPGQLRKKALEYSHPVYQAHSRARLFARERRHRLHHEALRSIRDRQFGDADLAALSGRVREDAIKLRLLIPTPEGGVVYPSREAWDRWIAHNREITTQAQKTLR